MGVGARVRHVARAARAALARLVDVDEVQVPVAVAESRGVGRSGLGRQCLVVTGEAQGIRLGGVGFVEGRRVGVLQELRRGAAVGRNGRLTVEQGEVKEHFAKLGGGVVML